MATLPRISASDEKMASLYNLLAFQADFELALKTNDTKRLFDLVSRQSTKIDGRRYTFPKWLVAVLIFGITDGKEGLEPLHAANPQHIADLNQALGFPVEEDEPDPKNVDQYTGELDVPPIEIKLSEKPLALETSRIKMVFEAMSRHVDEGVASTWRARHQSWRQLNDANFAKEEAEKATALAQQEAMVKARLAEKKTQEAMEAQARVKELEAQLANLTKDIAGSKAKK